MKRKLLVYLSLYFFGSFALGLALLMAPPLSPAHQDLGEPVPKKDEKPAEKHGRGYKKPAKETLKLLYELSNLKHARLKAAVPAVTLAAYDARTEKNLCVPPVGDQDGCGDCYMWSGCKAGAACVMTNKLAPQDGSFMLAPSYGLDCQSLGGCGGGDEYEVATTIRDKGWPSQKDYGGDGYTPGRCKGTTGMTLWKVDSVVMVGSSSGVAAVQDIKNYIYQSGYVSVAGAAGSDWDNVGPNSTITGRSSDVNHAIGLVAWDDAHDNGDNSKGAWVVQNNWGTSWGTNGYAWIKYGADSIGTEAFVCWNNAQVVKPFPPSPTPPVPPAGGAPVITSSTAVTVQVNVAMTYQIVATNAPTTYGATGLPTGLSINNSTGQISGIPTATGVSSVTITATNATGAGAAVLTLTVSTTPPPAPSPTGAKMVTILNQDGSMQTLFPITPTTTMQDVHDIIDAQKHLHPTKP